MHGFTGYGIPQLCGFSRARIFVVQNSVVVWIFMGPDLLGTEFHSCADFMGTDLRGTEFRSCADFHGHEFSWYGIP